MAEKLKRYTVGLAAGGMTTVLADSVDHNQFTGHLEFKQSYYLVARFNKFEYFMLDAPYVSAVDDNIPF